MKKKTTFYFWQLLLICVVAFVLSGCGIATPTDTPTLQWQPMPTYDYYIPPSNMPGYTHYIPSESFTIHLEFDYPSYWWLQEHTGETGTPSIDLGDPRILALPTQAPGNFHPTPNDFGSVYIWIIPNVPGQSPDTELESHKLGYSEIPRIKVLGDYKIMIDGNESSVLEYQENDPETSPSLMFYRRTYFMVNGQVYEIIYSVADKDRGGEFDKGYDHFLNSLKIVP
ncbi:MAG: hypothetical protein IPG44_07140 [Anaerolineales bacterium]|nr:hypothetical protein [Anaerolineales bacterium]